MDMMILMVVEHMIVNFGDQLHNDFTCFNKCHCPGCSS